MSDRITANLPVISFDETEAFYRTLGFERDFRNESWMILTRGPLVIEFFPYPELIPAESWFSACVRVGDLDPLFAEWSAVGLPGEGIPRLTPPQDQPFGLRMAALIDCNGSLLRILSPN